MNKRLFIIQLNWVDGFSLSGLACALFAIGCIFKQKFDFAISLLCIAMLIDIFDGILARKFDTCRPFGRHLDSFIDVIDYLVAPLLLFYLSGFTRWYQVAVLILATMAGIVRLSVFNEIGNIKNARGDACYLGMPVYWMIPILMIFHALSWFFPVQSLFAGLAVTLGFYSVLMVSNATFSKLTRALPISVVLIAGASVFALKGISG